MAQFTKTFLQLFENEHLTDCEILLDVFDGSGEEGEYSMVSMKAHRVILSTASPIFKKMIMENTEIINNSACDIIIDPGKVAPQLYRKFLRLIYGAALENESPEETLQLYELCHQFQTDNVLKTIIDSLKEQVKSIQNAVKIANIAWKYNEDKIKNACKKIFARELMKDENNLLLLDAVVVNDVYKMDPLAVDTEDLLVRNLEKYLDVNTQEGNKRADLIDQLTPAIKSIRFMLVTDDIIKHCSFLSAETKNMFLCMKNQEFGGLFLTIIDGSFSFEKEPRLPAKLLSFLPFQIIGEMYRLLHDKNCWFCRAVHSSVHCKFISQNVTNYKYLALNIYPKYKHTRLEDYSDDDIKAILDIFQCDAKKKGKISYYKKFLNYTDYL